MGHSSQVRGKSACADRHCSQSKWPSARIADIDIGTWCTSFSISALFSVSIFLAPCAQSRPLREVEILVRPGFEDKTISWHKGDLRTSTKKLFRALLHADERTSRLLLLATLRASRARIFEEPALRVPFQFLCLCGSALLAARCMLLPVGSSKLIVRLQ